MIITLLYLQVFAMEDAGCGSMGLDPLINSRSQNIDRICASLLFQFNLTEL